MTKLIGVCGNALNGLPSMGSGKDTFADDLCNRYGYEKYEFARPLKSAILSMFVGWTEDHVYGNLKDSFCPMYQVTPRDAMQKLGTEFARNMVNHDFWLIAAQQQINSNFMPTVVSDVRFDNEALFILNQGGIIVNIQRNQGLIYGAEGHTSEQGISGHLVTETIVNDGGLTELYEKVDHIYERYLKI